MFQHLTKWLIFCRTGHACTVIAWTYFKYITLRYPSIYQLSTNIIILKPTGKYWSWSLIPMHFDHIYPFNICKYMCKANSNNHALFSKECVEVSKWVRATSHTGQEPWPWNCESPKESCSKAVPRHLQDHVVWSQTLECSVKPYVTGSSTKCYFYEFLFVRVFTHDNIKQINGCERSECHGLPVLCWAYLQEVVLGNSPSDHKTWSIRCHVGTHVDLTSILRSHTPLVPQAQCEANLDRLRLFHQRECLKCNLMVTCSQSRVWQCQGRTGI